MSIRAIRTAITAALPALSAEARIAKLVGSFETITAKLRRESEILDREIVALDEETQKAYDAFVEVSNTNTARSSALYATSLKARRVAARIADLTK
jgi:hypothetical protein